MRKYILSAVFAGMAFGGSASTPETITLPEPSHPEQSTSLDEALRTRRSCREFDKDKMIDKQTLSNLLWSAAGINRPESGKRTNPTALNTQEIDLYVFDTQNVYYYDYKNNKLKKVASGDNRKLLSSGQDFVEDAPVTIVIIANPGKFEIKGEMTTMMSAIDAGIVSQNINLFCAANGLATVPRASMDREKISKLLNLPSTSIPMLNNPVGYEAK